MFKKFLILALFVSFFIISCRGKDSSASLPQNVTKFDTNHQLSSSDKIEVLKFIWLGCPSCQEFHTNGVNLKKEFGDKIILRDLPAVFDKWVFDSRVHIAMTGLGITDDGLLANYYEVRQGADSQKFAEDNQEIARWLNERYDIEPQSYLDMFDSIQIDIQIDQIRELMKKYPITKVPSVLISIPKSGVTYLVNYVGASETEKIIRDLISPNIDK